MASTSSRRSCFSRRPPRPPVLPGGGSSGSMIAHCTSGGAEEGDTAQRSNTDRRAPPRPPVLPGGGSSGSMIAHCTSVVAEEGYTAQRGNPDRRSRPMVLWAGQDAQVQVGEDDTRTPGRWWRRHLPAYQESARPRRRTPVPGHVLSLPFNPVAPGGCTGVIRELA